MQMTQHMQKALFLDRDGVVNKDKDYVHQIKDFEFQEGIFDLCRMANHQGYLIFIITNQAGIARGYYSERDFILLTKWMLNEFRREGCFVSKVYYCPYHPEYGNEKYKRVSAFRKPAPGMILKAAKRFEVDLTSSLLVGDQETDIEAGINAGIGKNFLLFNPEKKVDFAFRSNYKKIKNLDEVLPFLN